MAYTKEARVKIQSLVEDFRAHEATLEEDAVRAGCVRTSNPRGE